MLVMFPGQGSQKIGMGKDIFDLFSCAREVFYAVDDAISFKLSDLIFYGTEEELKATENAQPALMTVSIAFLDVLKKEFGIDIVGKSKYLAGHSLGEYTALCAAGVISLTDTARILRVRGKAMAESYPSGGTMAAIIGLDINVIQAIVDKVSINEHIVQIANDNSIGQIVISGHTDAVKAVITEANALGAKKTVILDVSGPFHSQLMYNASKVLEHCLSKYNFNTPQKPIISNVTAVAEIDNFKELLLKQITKVVRWRESILFAEKRGISTCIEIGSGKVLTGLVKRISNTVKTINISDINSIKALDELHYQ